MTIQQQLQSQSKVDVRIGIHLGDVVLDADGVYGDGVNLASRIESLAVPGSVFISEKVYDEIKSHESILTRSLGYFELKNVKQPVQIFSTFPDNPEKFSASSNFLEFVLNWDVCSSFTKGINF